MNILVTGSSGFVGEAIVEKLIQEGHQLTVLSRIKNIQNIDGHNIAAIQADIRNADAVNNLKLPENLDAVIHTAGLAHQFGSSRKRDFWDVNVDGTKNIVNLAVAHSVKHFILISSVAVYGNAGAKKLAGQSEFENLAIDESFQCNPRGFYAESKFEAEKAARDICEKNQIPLTILRLATVIGENDPGNVARLIRMIYKKRFFWIGDGENYKSLIYRGDVARACAVLLREKKNGTDVFNLAAEPFKMKQIVSEIAKALGVKIPKIKFPPFILRNFFQANRKSLGIEKLEKISEVFEKWLSNEVYTSAKIKREYGFKTETTVEAALEREVKYFLANKCL